MAASDRASAFANLIGQHEEIQGVEGLAGDDLDGELVAVRRTLLAVMGEGEALDRAEVIAKLVTASVLIVRERRAARGAGDAADDLSKALEGLGLGEQ